ncbi:hypothetical protein COCON_G00035200 [Conger conger]|uniref:Uncharacterized protein n=1 Tax=Conger conger TaxID=82655 RepID=A0A9Q1I7J7_CONCO|nr:hypothetical protein COCON_G00035200 [Conger conger]
MAFRSPTGAEESVRARFKSSGGSRDDVPLGCLSELPRVLSPDIARRPTGRSMGCLVSAAPRNGGGEPQRVVTSWDDCLPCAPDIPRVSRSSTQGPSQRSCLGEAADCWWSGDPAEGLRGSVLVSAAAAIPGRPCCGFRST